MSTPLLPDEPILRGIFPSATHIRLNDCQIISNTFNSCNIRLRTKTALHQHYPKDLFIRLQTSSLAGVAWVHRLAYAQLPNLVPCLLDVGETLSQDDRQIYYCILTYCTDTVPLDEVWDTLDTLQQAALMDAVVHAIEKLQELSLGNLCRDSVLRDTEHGCTTPGMNIIGGPKLGISHTMDGFLCSIVAASQGVCKLRRFNGSLILTSVLEDMNQLELTDLELDDLRRHAVLCHNDLEPRNILVRRRAGYERGNTASYELAAIIDWEMAGIYPFAYEYGVKDVALGSSNLSFSWYQLFKEKTSHLVPPAAPHDKLIKLLGAIDDAKKRQMPRNVGIRVQAKWIDREEIERAQDPRQGWTRKSGCQRPRTSTREEQEALELEVLSELGLA